MNCPTCGTMIPPGLSKCPSCGRSLAQSATSSGPTAESRFRFHPAAIAILILILIPILFSVWNLIFRVPYLPQSVTPRKMLIFFLIAVSVPVYYVYYAMREGLLLLCAVGVCFRNASAWLCLVAMMIIFLAENLLAFVVIAHISRGSIDFHLILPWIITFVDKLAVVVLLLIFRNKLTTNGDLFVAHSGDKFFPQ